MNFLLIYFSGTGNTELISAEIAERLRRRGHSARMISIEETEELQAADFDNQVVGFGFPIYKFTYPDIFRRVLPMLNGKADGTPCFLFSTYARFPGDALELFRMELDPMKFLVRDEAAFKAPSCGISARKDPEDYEYASVMFFEDGIDEKLTGFTDRLAFIDRVERSIEPVGIKLSSRLRLKAVENIEKTKYPKLQIDRDTCTACGLCAARCPDRNLEIQNREVVILDDTSCLHCLRCINRCPANAITFGKLTNGSNQYSLRDRDSMFRSAMSGEGSPYWKDFGRVVRKWRRRTLRYWLRYRNAPEY